MNEQFIFWGDIALLISIIICAAYLKEKGKNQATKEDIGKITAEIEKVKNDFAHLLNINSFRYQKEYKILIELMECLVAYREISKDLITFFNTSAENTHSEESNTWLSQNLTAYKKFKHNAEKYRPFYPRDIYDLINQFDTAVKSTILNAIVLARSRPEDYEKFLQRIEAFGRDITRYSDEISDAIRKRVKTWELNMPEVNE